jgi:hypothetical protein
MGSITRKAPLENLRLAAVGERGSAPTRDGLRPAQGWQKVKRFGASPSAVGRPRATEDAPEESLRRFPGPLATSVNQSARRPALLRQRRHSRRPSGPREERRVVSVPCALRRQGVPKGLRARRRNDTCCIRAAAHASAWADRLVEGFRTSSIGASAPAEDAQSRGPAVGASAPAKGLRWQTVSLR